MASLVNQSKSNESTSAVLQWNVSTTLSALLLLMELENAWILVQLRLVPARINCASETMGEEFVNASQGFIFPKVVKVS